MSMCAYEIWGCDAMQVSIQEERQQKILEMILVMGKVYVHELAATFNVTQETIRRDLSSMEAQKLLKKVHGGALSLYYDNNLNSRLKFEHNFQERIEFAKQEKSRIAVAAMQFISSGDTLFVDFGSTTLEFARALVKINKATVICNSPLIAEVLQSNPAIDVILTGGKFYSDKFECLGSITINHISNFFADYAIVGAGAIHQNVGIMDQDIEEAEVAKKMIQHSRNNIVLADMSKFGKYASSCVMSWKDIGLIVTNKQTDTMDNLDEDCLKKLVFTDE